MPPSDDTDPRAGRVAIVGRPNVGKSTLLNALLGQKLAITTPKPGTTRSNLLGVYVRSDPPTQIALVDTPGLERPRSVLGRVLVEEAQAALEEVDAVLAMVDATRKGPGGAPLTPEDEAMLAQVQRAERPVVLALNKVDKLKDKRVLLPRLAALDGAVEVAALVPLSALSRDNVDAAVRALREVLPPGVLYDDDEFLTDRPERYFAAERVREAAMRQLREEVPYGVAVQLTSWDDEGPRLRIGADLIIERQSHKGIVIGQGGSRLRDIGTEARESMQQFFQRPVVLQLFVRVQEGWTKDAMKVRELTRGTDS